METELHVRREKFTAFLLALLSLFSLAAGMQLLADYDVETKPGAVAGATAKTITGSDYINAGHTDTFDGMELTYTDMQAVVASGSSVLVPARKWVVYTATGTTPGSYALNLQASAQTPTKFRIEANHKTISPAEVIDATASTINAGVFSLAAGDNAIRIIVDEGALEVHQLELTPQK